MTRSRLMLPAIAGLFLVLLASSSLFMVTQTQQALIVRLGQPRRIVTEPGLHLKIPLLEAAITFDRRLLDYAVPPEEVILGDQRRLIVDSFVRYRITNPLRTYQSVGATEEGIVARLNSVESSALRRVLGNERLLDVLSSNRTKIMAQIRDQVDAEMSGFGVKIEDVRIRRADLPGENTQAILQRMQSERERIARQARAEGAEAAARIRANAERERTVLLADAKAEADRLRGLGEATAIATYAEAVKKDPGFFQTWRTLQAYRDALTAGNTRLVLSPDADFLKMLEHRPATTPDAKPTPQP